MKQKDLFDRIRKVLRQGWVDIPEGRGYGGTGGPGLYLEYLLGTTAGSEDIPDAGKWEIKTTKGGALVTLFHKTPSPKGIVREMLNLWGWTGKGGYKSFRHTISGRSEKGFRVIDDGAKVLIRKAGYDGPVPYWTHDELLNSAGAKLRRLVLVRYEKQKNKVRYIQADCFLDFALSFFIYELVRGTICVDFDVRATDTKALRDHGTKFRIAPDDVCRVYLNKKRFV